MARKDALLKITKILLARRNELRKRLGADLQDLGYGSSGSGDIADAAFGTTGEELASQLAQMEANELNQIELALQRIKQGRYGICDICEKKIPVMRLNALPYSIMCVKCQQEAEKDDDWLSYRMQSADWSQLRDGHDDADYDLSKLEIDMTK
jgi:DnaK suppressor protein